MTKSKLIMENRKLRKKNEELRRALKQKKVEEDELPGAVVFRPRTDWEAMKFPAAS